MSLRLALRKPGIAGEKYASLWLQHNFFWIVDRNWKLSTGEIDLIAINQRTLHFIEVKTRAENTLPAFRGDLAVDLRKIEKLRLLAERYIYRKVNLIERFRIKDFQFDIISITYRKLFYFYDFNLNYLPCAFPWRD
jgi:putative endonuclease